MAKELLPWHQSNIADLSQIDCLGLAHFSSFIQVEFEEVVVGPNLVQFSLKCNQRE